jgi:purine-binding chemotaxis protein CheW
MNEPLPQIGFAEDFLSSIQPADPADPNQIATFVDQVAPQVAEAAVPVDPMVHLVTFLLAEELYAVPVERVREVVRVQQITRVPQAPAHIRGVHGLRGVVLPVLEARTRLGLDPATLTAASRIVVVESRGKRLGLLVDGVHQVCRVAKSRIEPPPPEVRSRCSEYIVGTAPVNERLALLLDLDKLLLLPELAP